ncbi:hypothetical protein ENSA5_31130 [Enhygromyxa salina]|uniref:Uncharacterized protein n=1 Tax=Enhygromyxa salina TaxID=215803 RepID=A0A2S9XYR0_9BACT|nr:hypothetical protein [Enhygromyxa salina]PRP97880.1 hypothetical protein ENSA5_31130 [Enhygromyxa salina]
MVRRLDELDAAMREVGGRIVRRSTFGLGRVALVADNSCPGRGR